MHIYLFTYYSLSIIYSTSSHNYAFVLRLYAIIKKNGGRWGENALLFKVARLLCNFDRHIAACVEIAPLNGDPGAPRNGSLRWLDAGEIRGLDKTKTKQNFS